MAKRKTETPGKCGMQAPKSSVPESLPHRNMPANPRQHSNEGFARLKRRLKMKDYTEPRIYFGCAAKKLNGVYLPDELQDKSMTCEWYITWNHFHPKKNKRVQVRKRMDINRFHTLEEKYDFAVESLKGTKDWLEAGNNPWILARKEVTLSDALDKAFERWKERPDNPRPVGTIYDYDNTRKLFLAYSKDFAGRPVKEIKRPEVRAILDHMQLKRGFGNTRYNFIKGTIGVLFGEMIELGYIETNPFTEMQGKRKEKPQAHKPFTPDEKKKIRDRFLGDPFYVMPMSTYYASIRHTEQTKLLIEDIDIENGVIYLDGIKTKSSNPRVALLHPQLYLLMLRYGFLDKNPKWYVFGNEDFSPSAKQQAKKRQSEYWRKIVKAKKEHGGLGIDKNMYGLKHTAGDDLLDVGVDENLIKDMYGHTAVRMTKKYLTQQKQALFKKVAPKIKEFGT